MGDDHARSTIAGHAGVAHTVGPAVRTGPQEHAVTRRELLLLAEIIGAQDAERKVGTPEGWHATRRGTPKGGPDEHATHRRAGAG
jgi:hypothetical protein